MSISDDAIRVLPTAYQYIRHNRSLKDQYDDRTLQQAAQIADKCSKVTNSTSSELVELLQVEGIDSGEALLFAATAAEPDSYIVTADKTCLKALTNSGSSPVVQRLAHRVICLEQIIICQLRQSPDPDKVIRRVRGAAKCEVSVTEAFKLADPEAMIQKLEQEVALLRSQTGNLLVL